MKTKLLTIGMLVAALGFAGCEDNEILVGPHNDFAPAVPRGVTSITGDRSVEILWYENTEPDLDGYYVYRSDKPNGPYKYIATVTGLGYYRDRGLINGFTYFYAVSAFDYDGNESELSYEDVFDTPRPSGNGVVLYDFDTDEGRSGFDFSEGRRVPATSSASDIFIDYDESLHAFFVEIADLDVYIQDFGSALIDDLDWAPYGGWSKIGYCELIVSHTYVIRDAEGHYGKFYVGDMSQFEGYVVINWACQSVPNNHELRVNPHINEQDRVLRRLLSDGTIDRKRR